MYNGAIVIAIRNPANLVVEIEGNGSIVKVEQEVQDILDNKGGVVMTTRNVQCFYIKDLAKAANYKINLQQVGDKVGFYLSR